jgi:hypothetical protein
VKALKLHELIEEVLGEIEGVSTNLSETEEVAEPWVGLLERAALRLAEMKDWTFRVETSVPGLRTVTANGSTKIKEVQ